jgi:putative methyltransferase
MMRRQNVLISVPNNNPKHVVYLPTIWATLKTHASRSPVLLENVEWLDPIIFKDLPERLLAPYGDRPIHVLGLSCYSWNTNTNMALAQYVRARHPDCLIVAGGPHLDWKTMDFFAEYPAIDAVVVKDGEIPFTAILEQLVEGRRDLESIPGLILPPRAEEKVVGKRLRDTGRPVLPSEFELSPWLENAPYLESLMAKLRAERPGRPVGIAWEIDRGCPYDCTFCDWGSNTNSKVRAFPLPRLQAEADWIARNRIHVAFLTVANFGLIAHDEQVLDSIIEGKKQHGFPRVFIWNNAKNNVARVVRMNERAFAAGLVDYHILSVQSLDQDVLAAMNRADIGKTRLLEVIEHVKGTGMPCVAQFIFGGPADTPEKFVRSLTGLMELGIHDEYVAYPFDILPNAPANTPEYREKWGIRTVTRKGAVNKRDPNLETTDYSTIIVGTNSYDEADFVKMYVHGRLIIAMHNSGLTMHASRYLRRSQGVPYYDFYATVIERMFQDPAAPWHWLYTKGMDHIAAFIAEDGVDRVESIEIEDLPGFDYWVNVEEYLLYKFMIDTEGFYAALNAVLADAFQPPLLDSVLAYSRAVMIDPSYDPRQGRRVVLDHDWPEYFLQVDAESSSDGPAPVAVEANIKRRNSGSQFQYKLDWWERANSPTDAMHLWVQIIVGKHYQRVERAYFKGIDDISTRQRLAPRLIAAE